MCMAIFERDPRHRHNHAYCGCSLRRRIIEGTILITLKIIFLPIVCPVYSGVRLQDWYKRRRDYVSPEELERRNKERLERAIAKKIPRVLPLRLGDEVFLTYGKEEVVEMTGGERNGKGKDNIKPRGITDPQKDSSLFRLPAEVRILIWTEVIGGYLFHVRYIEAYKRMGLTRCKHSFADAACIAERCNELMKQKGVKDKWGNIELLSLLQTCRLIYAESVEVLYRENTFCFTSLRDVKNFSLLVPSSRMKAMRSVRWRHFGGDTDETYLTTTPWLECKAPDACECIECWPKSIELAIVNGEYRAEALAENRWLFEDSGQYRTYP